MASIRGRTGQFQFSTLVGIAGEDIFALESQKIIKRINSTANPLSLHPVVIVADPFLFVYNEQLYLFYEEQIDLTGKGRIKMTKTGDLKNWSDPVTVLEENFHLSFPNVFELDGQIYMMPETGNDNSIRLYTPNNELTEWTYAKTLLTGCNFVDSSIVVIDGCYFLFTTDYADKKNVLKLYFAEHLDGTWTEHPQSPIAVGNNTGRCAGSVFFYNELRYRPSQRTDKRYGEGVDLYQITALSKDTYLEQKRRKLIPNSDGNYREGGHHFNCCSFQNKTVIATDILEVKFNVYEVWKRIMGKFIRV